MYPGAFGPNGHASKQDFGRVYCDEARGSRPSSPRKKGRQMFAAEERLTETKPFFLTSEFLFLLVALGALAVTALADDSFGERFFWPLATALVVAYISSRGFGKANAPSRSF